MQGIIISITSDIATAMALRWQKMGWNLCGTYCTQGENFSLLKNTIPLVHCDLSDRNSLDTAVKNLTQHMPVWDFIIFATGSQEPIGPFSDTNIDEWMASIHINFLHQMYVLHQLLPYKNPDITEKAVLFFAGGGTNNTVINYSAYTISKIALIKSCELLDSEIDDVKFSIIGPGWVKTKIHEATLKVGDKWAGHNFEKTKAKLQSDECVSVEQVINSFEWTLSQSKKVVGGRNFSTQFDQWGTAELADLLIKDVNMYKLRRNGNDTLIPRK